MSKDDFDWIFDVVLQVLEGESFDAAIMDFVDQHCEAFDSIDEENRLEFTEIHNEFVEHVEALIMSECAELGITPEVFYEACDVSRKTRDVNMSVFDRLVAIDDFQTFKKIMVKRNVELQLEALRSFRLSKRDDGAAADEPWHELDDETAKSPSAMKAVLNDTFLEMQLLHKQERLEQDDLALAVAMSLSFGGDDAVAEAKSDCTLQGQEGKPTAADDARRRNSFLLHATMDQKDEEDSRLHVTDKNFDAAMVDARRRKSFQLHAAMEEDDARYHHMEKNTEAALLDARRRKSFQLHAAMEEDGDRYHEPNKNIEAAMLDARRRKSFQLHAAMEEDDSRYHHVDKSIDAAILEVRRQKNFLSHSTMEYDDDLDRDSRLVATKALEAKSTRESKSDVDEKPRGERAPITPLKPLGRTTPLQPLPSIASPGLSKLAAKAENVLEKSKQELERKKDIEESLQSQLDPLEIERRAAHLRKQQKLIIEMKKRERDAKLNGKEADTAAEAKSSARTTNRSSERKSDGDAKSDDVSRRRAVMSMALANRLKDELSTSNGDQAQDNHMSDLHRKLKQVEQSRQKNEQRERHLAAYLSRQNIS